ncbi:amino acid adenylation domain-containing protein, partial [Fulvivirgaceae bacterium BMA12]|nr:amino acid adenylation domain-containing protein [Fulvivirgaceae bacterium BMA12]
EDYQQELICYYTGQERVSDWFRMELSIGLNAEYFPSYYVWLDEFPLNVNGKVDRKLLPKPIALEDTDYEPPVDELELRLSEIWQVVLGDRRISRKASFFALDGSSLKAMQLVSHIYKEFEVLLKIGDLFSHPTLAGQAALIRAQQREVYEEIEPIAKQEDYALSHGQRRLWVLDQLENQLGAYSRPIAYRLEGSVSVKSLRASFSSLLARHENLRTVFLVVKGEPRQKILSVEESGFELDYKDLRDDPQAVEHVKQISAQMAGTAFDLSTGPLLRVKLLQLSETSYVFAMSMHHIVSDEWSMQVLFKEVLLLYNADVSGESNPLRPLSIHYKDYAQWQMGQLSGDRLRSHHTYWMDQLSGELPLLELPTDYPRPSVKTYNGDNVSLVLDPGLSAKLKMMGDQEGVTLFMVLLSTVYVLLYRYTGQKDLIVGTPVAGREHLDLEDQIGFFVNILALRMQISGEESFKELLGKVKGVSLEGFAHQQYPFDKLVEELPLERDLSRSPLFDIMMVLQNQPSVVSPVTMQGVDVSAAEVEVQTSLFDLTFSFFEQPEHIHLVLNYNSDLFSQGSMERLLEHYRQLLKGIDKDIMQPLHSLPLLTHQEEHFLDSINSTDQSYPEEETLVSLFEQQVDRTPGQIALVFGQREYTYSELNDQSNQLAHYIRDQYTLQSGDLVGLLVERGIEMIVGILGILKAGAAYLPIDVTYPKERIDYLLEDGKVDLLLTQSEYLLGLSHYHGSLFALDEQLEGLTTPTDNPLRVNKPTDLAYVIYTSGTTGRPKGVMIAHNSVVNRITWQWKHYGFDAKEVILQKTPFVFDVSVWELFMSLCYGARLVLCQKHVVLDPLLITAHILRYGITTIHFVPSMLELFLSAVEEQTQTLVKLKSLRRVFSSGEVLSVQQVKRYYAKLSVPLHNLYGPTEATVDVSYYPTQANDLTIPIGRPIGNTVIYVVDDWLNQQPIGVIGEILIGGTGLARGYLHQEALTEEKFIRNPFGEGRLYKTGDLGYWNREGALEYLGRKDDQVKLRGYRIELGEVERVLLEYEGVSQAVVLLQEGGGNEKQIVGYYVKGGDMDEELLREHLQAWLPAYMLPSVLVELEFLPLMVNGKIDKKSLPGIDQLPRQRAYVAPVTDTERQLVEIWEQVLGREEIGVEDNFFELGGDSIKAIQIAARLYKQGLQLELQDLFQYPNIHQIVGKVKQVERLAEQGAVVGLVPLTPIQRWFFSRSSTQLNHYNQAVLLTCPPGLDKDILEKMVNKLQLHHDALRMRFRQVGGRWQQYNEGEVYSSWVREYDLKTYEQPERELELLADRVQASIELGQGPLLKAAIFHLPEGDRLLLVIHHLVVDTVSWRIILEDLSTLFQQCKQRQPLQLATKTDSYKYWAEQLLVYAQNESLQQQQEYWQQIEQASADELTLDYQGTNFLRDAASASFSLDQQQTQQLLTEVPKAYGTEINDALLTALALSLNECFGISKVKIALEGHGREQILEGVNVSRTVGWFTTMYPLLLQLEPAQSMSYQLKQIKETLRQVPLNGIGYGILRHLHNWQYHPPAISFNYLGQFDRDFSESTFGLAPESTGRNESLERKRSFQLEVDGSVVEGQLRINLAYSRQQYRQETIEQLAMKYQKQLLNLIIDCVSKQERELTPSDLTINKLSDEELKAVSKLFGN